MNRKTVILWLLLTLVMAPLAWTRTHSTYDSYNRRARTLKTQDMEAAVAAATVDFEKINPSSMIMAQKAHKLGGTDFESLFTLLAQGSGLEFLNQEETDSLFMETFRSARGNTAECQRLFDFLTDYNFCSPRIGNLFLEEMDGFLPDTVSVRLLRISALMADAKTDETNELAESLAAQFPADYRVATAFMKLASIFADSTYMQRGTAMMEDIISHSVHPDELIYLLSSEAAHGGTTLSSAIARRLLELDPDSYEGHMALIYSAQSAADSLSSRKALETIISHSDIYTDDEAENALKLMTDAVGSVTAEPWFVTLIDSLERVQPDRPFIARTRYLILDAADSPEALQYLLSSQARFPEDTSLTAMAVEAIEHDGRYLEALEVMDRYLQQYQDIADTPVYMALYRLQLLFDLQRYAEVIDYVDAIRSVQPVLPNPRFYAFASSAAAQIDDYRRALDYTLLAIEAAPDQATYYNDAAYFMALLNTDLAQAENYAAKAAEMEPSNPSFFDTYAWVKFRAGDYHTARQLIDECITMSTEYSQETEEAIAKALELIQNPPEEVTDPIDEQAAQKQIALTRNNVRRLLFEVYAHAGDIYFMLDLPDNAVQLWLQALDYAHSLEKVPDDTETISEAALERLEKMVETHSYLPQTYDL
ncbi:MAG: hypothetical protein K2M79_02185 [Muribaculaceae bacterium]|nr:hypothetical protein [Muribaculaceae bacterium]